MAGLRSRLDALLKQADLAMDRAKRARPGAAHIFTADPDRGEHDKAVPRHIPPPTPGPRAARGLSVMLFDFTRRLQSETVEPCRHLDCWRAGGTVFAAGRALPFAIARPVCCRAILGTAAVRP